MTLRIHWSCDLDLYRSLQCIILLLCSPLVIGISRQESACGETDLKEYQGTISSPNYPTAYPEQIYCEWKIRSPSNSILKIKIVDFDIESDDSCPSTNPSPCCMRHWLVVPHEGGRGSMQLCGNNWTDSTIRVSQPVTSIKYFSGKDRSDKAGGRGFEITYVIDVRPCQSNELQCMNGKCVHNDSFCNSVDDCGDGSDEKNCVHIAQPTLRNDFASAKALELSQASFLDPGRVCPKGRVPCHQSPNHCFSPAQLCNGQFDCPKGEDELSCVAGCQHQIACSSGDGCFFPSQRCNSIRNCRDNSDETGCPEPCGPLQFVCMNRLCVPGSAVCDGDDDCGDQSDEDSCTKSSLMTAAVMGLLACIFLFCIGLSCLYRVYTARLRASAGFVQRLEPEPLDEDFVYREPPPAYSVAVNDARVISYPAPEMAERFFESEPAARSHRSRSTRRSRRRHRSSETPRSRPRPAPHLAPPAASALPPPEPHACKPAGSHFELCGFGYPRPAGDHAVPGSACANDSPCSSPSLSPSRESVTSSTSLEDPLDLVRTHS